MENKIDHLTSLFQEAIVEKDARIKELTDQLLSLSQEKEQILEKKIESELKLKDLSEKVSKLKKIKKDAQDSVMGSTFEQDRLKKEVEAKEKEIQVIEERIASVASGSTGIFFDLDGLNSYILTRIEEATRQLRLVVPTVDYLYDHNLLAAMENLSEKCVVNLATAFDLDLHAELIAKLKARGWYLTQYTERNLVCISANGVDVGITFIKNEGVSGFYTNIEDLVSIFNQAVMHAYIRGIKL
jgi:hypothetical protein